MVARGGLLFKWAREDAPWEANWKAKWVDYDGEGSLFYAFERFFAKRGEGADSLVAWHPRSRNFQKEMERRQLQAAVNPLPSDRTDFITDRPMWAALAHELIHAWRNVTGRVCFARDQTGDENMTVGLPIPRLQPYDTLIRIFR